MTASDVKKQALSDCTATDLVILLQTKEVSAVEVALDCLESIHRNEPKIHAWVHLNPDLVIKQAQAADKKLANGLGGSLCGVPVGVKDIFNTSDMPTQMGSPIWENFTPGNDARTVYNLRMADAVIMGKTVTAEFAVHAPGPTHNPHKLGYIPGTSSSGSAAATAAHMVPIALGTQTAGSIIRPASYCGVYGFKPSFGLIPRTGMLKTTDSLDSVGMFARCIDDLGLLFDTIRMHGINYPIAHAALNDNKRQTRGDQPWRIGLLRGPKWENAELYAQHAFNDFGAKIKALDNVNVSDFTLPDVFKQAHNIHSTIYDRGLAYYFKEEFVAKTLVSQVMYDIVQRGNHIAFPEYNDALKAQNQIAHQLDELLERQYDIVIDLSTGGEALEGLNSVDRLDNSLIWTLCGVPTLNIPIFSGPLGLPFGAQIFARRYSDYLLLEFARHLHSYGILQNNTPMPLFNF